MKNLRNLLTMLMLLVAFTFVTTSCEREPILHLHEGSDIDIEMPEIKLELTVMWDYDIGLGINYHWQSEWYYAWDEGTDEELERIYGYSMPADVYHMRRYFTGNEKFGPHKTVIPNIIYGSHYEGQFDWGYWDLLVWNDIQAEIQSIVIDERSTLEYVTAMTNQTTNQAHSPSYKANRPQYSRSFYQPDELFAAYDAGEEINKNMDGFTYDSERNVWVKQLDMVLEPVTYIYLTQVILHNNNGKIVQVNGDAQLSGMARTVRLNDGVAGDEAISVQYDVFLKRNCEMPHDDNTIEKVDIIGGRLLTFGMCNINANRVGSRTNGMPTRVDDGLKHYIDVGVQFYNGADSVFHFDVTDQVQRRYKGGVLTVELDMNKVTPPTIGVPGSGMDAVVEDWQDGGTHEIPM